MTHFLVGMTAPNSLSITITNSSHTGTGDEVDLSVYDYCRLLVRKPSVQTDEFWEATVSVQSPTSLTVVYEFESGDLSEIGGYVLKPRLSTTPFYQLMYTEIGVPPTKTELNPTQVRCCSNVDMEVYAS